MIMEGMESGPSSDLDPIATIFTLWLASAVSLKWPSKKRDISGTSCACQNGNISNTASNAAEFNET
jgi:hypothetical protein